MTDDNRVVHPDILKEAVHILHNHFSSEITLNSIQLLSEADRRNVLLRITLRSSSQVVPKSIIFKQSLPEPSDSDDKEAYVRFSRDWAGLEFISGIEQNAHNVPKFYGGSKAHRFILIEDLGVNHISLVDSLTGSDANKAVAALERFMRALGSFHAESFGQTPRYEQILKKINPGVDTLQDDLDFTLNDLLSRLELANQKLGLSVTSDLINEASHLIKSMYLPGAFTVLTHGDICPDNVFDHENTRDLQLIDFEWSRVRNALLDGTYLRMSMPTCWCAKAIPEHIIEPLELIYRNELTKTIPAAADDLAYNTAYTEACGFWLLQQTLPFLNSTLDNDRVGPSGPTPEHLLWKPEDNWVRPRVLSRLQAFIETAEKHNMLPSLRAMASTMLREAKTRWSETRPLELFPAFNYQEQQIIDLLKIHYGIDIQSAQLIPAGADVNALVYKADSKSNSYFIKLKYGVHDEINLSTIRLLHDCGIKEIIFPIHTLEAKLVQQLDHFKIIVYPFIHASNGFTQNLTERQWKQLGKVLRQIHGTSAPTLIQQQLRKETYPTKWREMVRSFYSQMVWDTADDKITTDFKTFFNQHIDTIHQIVDSAEELSKEIQPDSDNYVLCHSDIHAGNVLVINEESIYIIDWDEPMLAPKERDLMFIGGGVCNVWNKPHEIGYFYEGYGKTNVDKTMLSYYRHARIVEDIAEFGQILLSRGQNDQSRLESFNHFKAMFEPNDVVEIALLRLNE